MFDRLLQETMNGAYSTLQDFQDANLSVYICTWIFGLLMAYGIGANDVANTFSTSVRDETIIFQILNVDDWTIHCVICLRFDIYKILMFTKF